MNIMTRTVFKDGIERPENKGVEIHCTCECDNCKQRYEYSKYREHINVQLRNRVIIAVLDENQLKQAMEFAEKWRCKDGSRELPTEYLKFD